MRGLIVGWVVGSVVYLAVLFVTAALISAGATPTGRVTTWPLLVVPGALGAAAAALSVRARTRPTPGSGLAAVVVPAAVAAASGLAAMAEAARHADVPVGARLGTVLIPVVVMLAVGAGIGVLRGARWVEPATVPSYEEVA